MVRPLRRPRPSRASRTSARRRRRRTGNSLAFCAGLTPAALDATVVLDRGEGVRFEERTHAVLAHLFVHQIHHRGQVHAMLSGTSVAPPQLDEFFLDQDLPLRAAELASLGLEI